MTKPIRVALSGSGFKVPAHVGALMAIQDAGYEVVQIAGTSGGSIVASLLASGMSINAMHDLCMTMDWSPMLTFNPWSLITKMGYCSGQTLLDWLTEQTGGKTFRDLPIDLSIVASDVAQEAPYLFSKATTPDAPVALAARASAAIPGVYAPVQYGGALNFDGGMVDNMPSDCLTVDDIPRLSINLVSKGTPLPAGTHSLFSIAPRVIDLMLSSNENTHVDLDKSRGGHFAFIETGYASALDRNMAKSVRQRLMHDGYVGAQAALKGIG